MIGILTRSAAAFALLMLAASPGPIRADHEGEDERPDLKIELVGLSPDNPREVTFQVTNVSGWWADETTSRVATIAPFEGNMVGDIFVENLDPGQSTTFSYTLDRDCNGHVVRAEVAAAKNYAGVPEANLGNNKIDAQVCPARAQGVPKPEAPVVDTRPEHLRPGSHRAGGQFPPLTFKPSAVKSVTRYGGAYGDHVGRALDRYVGWYQSEGGVFDTAATKVHQTAVNFDLSQLDEVPNPFGLKALLTFDERAVTWRHGDGSPKLVNSCVSVLGIATVDWAAQPSVNALIPNSAQWDAPGGKKEWNVTDHVYDQINDRGNRALRYGYVLRGALEDVRGDDDDSCESVISNLQLTIEYAVIN